MMKPKPRQVINSRIFKIFIELLRDLQEIFTTEVW